jgi:hypothetical protein
MPIVRKSCEPQPPGILEAYLGLYMDSFLDVRLYDLCLFNLLYMSVSIKAFYEVLIAKIS